MSIKYCSSHRLSLYYNYSCTPAECCPQLFTYCEYWSFRHCLNTQSNSERAKLLLHLQSHCVQKYEVLHMPFSMLFRQFCKADILDLSYLTGTRFLVPSKHSASQKSSADYIFKLRKHIMVPSVSQMCSQNASSFNISPVTEKGKSPQGRYRSNIMKLIVFISNSGESIYVRIFFF